MMGMDDLIGGAVQDAELDAGFEALAKDMADQLNEITCQSDYYECYEIAASALSMYTERSTALRASKPEKQGEAQRAVGREIANIPPGITAQQIALGLSREQIDPLQSYRTTEDCLAYADRVMVAALHARPVGPDVTDHSGDATNMVPVDMPRAWMDVMGERIRQLTVEGWTAEHDDEHDDSEMVEAALCYIDHAIDMARRGSAIMSRRWPWLLRWWKPSDPRRNLVKAGALILAEIERLDRAARIRAALEMGQCEPAGMTRPGNVIHDC